MTQVLQRMEDDQPVVSVDIPIKALLTPVGGAAARRADLAHSTTTPTGAAMPETSTSGIECIFQVTNIFGEGRAESASNAAVFQGALEELENVASDVLVGTGEAHLDSRLAAVSGAAHLLVISTDADEKLATLTRRQLEAKGAEVHGVIREEELAQTLSGIRGAEKREPQIGPELFELNLLRQAKAKRTHIVLPEGEDDRILEAAHQLLADDVCELTILGNPDDISTRAANNGWDISAAHVADPTQGEQLEQFAQDFYELRKHKGISIEDARATMQDISYYATMMVHKGLADGMVSGAAHTTAHTIKPSFQIIKTAPGSSVVSSIFLLVMDGELWAFGDCAVNPNPTPDQLAEIAAVSAHTAAQFGIEPKVAMLSYSTGTSGSGPDVQAVAEAVAKAKETFASVQFEGPIQFDAAVVESVGQKKMPGSNVAGHANVFIFPDLNSGNIAYKAVQRTAGALAVGPILQGLNKPVNDLSRGATVPDIVNTVAITAIQAQA
ncbi:phosphate acetyltransferase [Corynebacterium auriscanis]|uniref:phosphate acetyltransferase n=1 Tax=Corynebacterium auriscanis TaxID=99807 RepID=UPI003CEF103D